MFPRVEAVKALLSRYADAEGCVTPRVVDGLVRLAGLNAREAALRNRVRVREAADEADELAVGAVEDPSPEGTDPSNPAGPELRPKLAAGDFAAAVAVALAVLEGDRFQLRPENRLLNAEAEVGLGVLVRGGANMVAREPAKEELGGLPPGDIGIRARNCLVLHNQRLVHSMLWGYLEAVRDFERDGRAEVVFTWSPDGERGGSTGPSRWWVLEGGSDKVAAFTDAKFFG
ncbi:hypothetical protein [Streptomyces sp. NPDC050704]|uniref:hypothetical protein n=1 Tax=Streptomyces sp. NPDC050704 TaxID=3157219 RepID=UPI0034164546